jgi:general secretion pathway protein G
MFRAKQTKNRTAVVSTAVLTASCHQCERGTHSQQPAGCQRYKVSSGFTLLELIITITVLTVLALGTIPLMQNAVRRQKEQRLRETLREIRMAIDQFHQDASGSCIQGGRNGSTGIGGGGVNFGGANPLPPLNGRSNVLINDCKIFEVDNYDRYPPTLEVLVEGVEVTSRNQAGGAGATTGVFSDQNATDKLKLEDADPKKKYYLREMPIDPLTGQSDWIIRSSYQEADADSWDNINVFDVRSSADGETLDGVKYKDL